MIVTQQPAIEFVNVGFSYADKSVLLDVNIAFAAGQITSIVGPSGCGKSSTLRLIAMLAKQQSGCIIHADSEAQSNGYLRFLHQNYDAYPWFTVWQNVKIGSGPPPYPDDAAVAQILEEVGLIAERSRYPTELSGGMRKRLGLARCLVRKPKVILLDEPFSALDIDTRYEMYALLQQLWQETGCAVIIVTHDIHEAIMLSDKIVAFGQPPVMQPEIIEIDFAHPRTDDITQSAKYAAIRQMIVGAIKL
ncbi:MAG: ABC transporter ATP-binding protein [Candidatus Melainabacteria bacterium]|nr:ABC transporter ATP-binding protein [Candidatus Melainabacteria bacterium]